MKNLLKIIKATVLGSEKEGFFYRYRAVTWATCLGTFLSILIFVVLLQHDLRTQTREFHSITRSEVAFIQKDLEVLESSLVDAHFRLKTQEKPQLEQIELVFRNELRSRLFGLIFFLPISQENDPYKGSYHLLSGDRSLISTEGLPNVDQFPTQNRPQVVLLPVEHPLYREGGVFVALPFEGQGSLYINIDLGVLLGGIAERPVFRSVAELFFFEQNRLIAKPKFPKEDKSYMLPIRELRPAAIKDFSAYFNEAHVGFLGHTWTALLVPSESFLTMTVSFYPWLFFGACLFITALISFAFYQMIAGRIETEETVKLRTRELQRKTDELGRVNKDLGDFAYIVSHDLQEPIRTVSTFLDVFLAENSKTVPQEGLHLLGRIKSAAQRMQRLLKDILKYSRLSTETDSFQLVRLRSVIQEVWDDLQAKVEETQASLRVETELPYMKGDLVQLRQLFMNLISNAIKFRHPERKPVIVISGYPVSGGAYWAIRVQDNGMGFDTKYSESIFKPFHRLHREEEVEGSGIGLAICRKIVERHEGEIRAESNKGEGSTFTVLLPVTKPGSVKQAA